MNKEEQDICQFCDNPKPYPIACKSTKCAEAYKLCIRFIEQGERRDIKATNDLVKLKISFDQAVRSLVIVVGCHDEQYRTSERPIDICGKGEITDSNVENYKTCFKCWKELFMEE